jgi:hypothetical protein
MAALWVRVTTLRRSELERNTVLQPRLRHCNDGQQFMSILCLLFGHSFVVVERSFFCFNPKICLEQSNPFALTQTTEDLADCEHVKKVCSRCRKTIAYEEFY